VDIEATITTIGVTITITIEGAIITEAIIITIGVDLTIIGITIQISISNSSYPDLANNPHSSSSKSKSSPNISHLTISRFQATTKIGLSYQRKKNKSVRDNC
jgi:hypothetical protein